MRSILLVFVVSPLAVLTIGGGAAAQVPPYAGSAFIDADIITPHDPTVFTATRYLGTGRRQVFDRRVNRWLHLEMQLFEATFSDGFSTEVRVNPEFGDASAAEMQATKYAAAIGQLPKVLRTDVESVTIHKGAFPYGGGNKNILIHTDQRYGSFLEEILVHEATHTSLDQAHANADAWLAAQQADGNFISTYARDFPRREDVAESFLPWLAARHRSDRMSQRDLQLIGQAIGNRLAYFDRLGLDLRPLAPFVDCDADARMTAKDLACVVSVADRDVVLAALGTVAGDLDGDGNVAFDDFLRLAANFQSESSRYTDGNIDLVDTIDFGDFLVLAKNYGYQRAAAAVSVPETAFRPWLLGLFLLNACRQRCRQTK